MRGRRIDRPRKMGRRCFWSTWTKHRPAPPRGSGAGALFHVGPTKLPPHAGRIHGSPRRRSGTSASSSSSMARLSFRASTESPISTRCIPVSRSRGAVLRVQRADGRGRGCPAAAVIDAQGQSRAASPKPSRRYLHQPLRDWQRRTRPVPRRLQPGARGIGFKAPRSTISRWEVATLDQGEESGA
jgi:hypothetical protein